MSRSVGTSKMIFKVIVLFTFAIFCESAIVDTLAKCKINDGDCQRDLYQSVIRDIGKTGIPELEIPPIDPIRIYNVSVPVLEVLELTLVDGVARGVKNCVINKFITDIENEHASMDITCDFTIKGVYNLESNPDVKRFYGENFIHGQGIGKVKIDQINIKFDYYFFPQIHNDGEIYMKCKFNDTKYTYQILGKAAFFADDIHFGDEEISTVAMALLNDNWQFFMKTFGKSFMNKAIEFVYIYTHKFFDKVPARYYISDDLTPYAKP